MSKDEILSRLYRKHTSWVLMAERMMPLYYSMTAEDVVQEVYLKIYQELREQKAKIYDYNNRWTTQLRNSILKNKKYYS